MSSSIDDTKPEAGSATTASVRQNFTYAKAEIEALQSDVAAAQSTADSAAMSAMQTLYPIGAIYLSTLATNPNTLLGFGTWAVFGAGRVLIGINAGDGDFDTLEETGGSKTHTLTTAEIPSHTHTQNSHNHTQDAHTHTQNAHTHTQDAHTHIQNAHNHTGTVGTSASGSITATGATVCPTGNVGVGSTTAVNQNATATNQNATATNQNTTATNQATTATNNNTGGDGAHTIVQPYIVVAMWKRTA